MARAAQYDLVLKLHQIYADPHVRRQTEMTKNNANEEGPDEFHFSVAKLLARVNPNNIELVASLLVDMIAKYNVRMTAKMTAKMNEGKETIQSKIYQSFNNMKNGKGKGKETEGQESKGKANIIAMTTPVQAPFRDYRDAQGKDHGYAMPQQYLNPPEDPCASI